MFTLQQAIELATKAHVGQWRKPRPPTKDESRYIIGETVKYIKDVGFLQKNGTLHTDDDNGNILIQQPYISHPLAVMNMMTTEEEKIVAVLHDVIECTHITFDALELAGVSKNCLEALIFLTHAMNEDYSQYISKMHLNRLAIKVKLADILHNMSDNPSEHAKQKYLKAIPILLQNL